MSISAAQPSDPVIYVYTRTLFFSYYLPSCSITRDWILFPLLYSKTSLLFHSKCKFASANPKLPVHPTPSPSPLAIMSWFSMSVYLFLFHSREICAIIQNILNLHMHVTIWYLSFSFWLTSLSMSISSCIHLAANGIISLFFMFE